MADGTALVTGFFTDTATFGLGEANETTLVSAGLWDVFVARYDAQGALDWARRAGGEGNDYAPDIAVLADGSALLTGYFEDAATFGAGDPEETLLASEGATDIFVARYDETGDLVWARSAGGQNGDASYGIAVLADGTAWLTGQFSGTATFGPGEPDEQILTSVGDADIFVARYSASGALLWVRSAGGGADDGGYSIAAIDDGSAFVTGTFSGIATFDLGEPGEATITSAGGPDIFVARYSP